MSKNQNTCRKFIAHGILTALGVVTIPLLYAVLIEPSWLYINHQDIVIPDLPSELEDFTIAQFSDTHLGSGIGERVFERAIKQVNTDGVDLAVFTGDYVDGAAYEAPERYAEQFARLAVSVNSRYGHFAVLGNHDHWLNAGLISAKLQEAGITVLDDTSVRLDIDGQGLSILGVDDTGIGMCPGKLSEEM